MTEQVVRNISIAIDVKKNRIRLHKPTLHLLGDPSLIQLLLDPQKMVLAIRCPEEEEPGGQEIKIGPHNFLGDNTCELYSRSLLTRMRAIPGIMHKECSYRLTGYVSTKKRVAVFPLNSLQEIGNEVESDG